MCGIIGYVGLDDAKKELLKGLQALEYRGYDSAGIAYCQPNGIKTIKTVGKVSCLKDKVAKEAADDVTTCATPAGQHMVAYRIRTPILTLPEKLL